MTKNTHPVTELLEGFRDLHANLVLWGGRAHFWARKFEYSKIGHNQAPRYSTFSPLCPEHRDTFLFEIVLKMTELRAITQCPNMGVRREFDHFWVIKWPNINIFQWDLFYMISIPKLHHISKFQLKSY